MALRQAGKPETGMDFGGPPCAARDGQRVPGALLRGRQLVCGLRPAEVDSIAERSRKQFQFAPTQSAENTYGSDGGSYEDRRGHSALRGVGSEARHARAC